MCAPRPPTWVQVYVSKQGERSNGAGEKISPQDAAAYKPSFFRNLAMRRYTPGAVSAAAGMALLAVLRGWALLEWCLSAP